jgi:tetratricopeptide (TPR) repeat protein
VAAELDVDLLLTGTLLRAGDRLRVGAELVEAPSGKAVWSQVSQVAIGDLFELQDALADRIITALPLTAADRDRAVPRDAPKDDQAYEMYLRANGYAVESSTWRLARDLYQQSLERDPTFAPAWARLGRIRRVLGKFSTEEDPASALAAAEIALRRALELNPALSGAHLYLAQLDTDLGRGEESIGRLLARARGGRAEPEILAGLVHACRYGGLLTASVAAHDLAVRLDPSIKTGVIYTYWAMGQYDRALQGTSYSSDTIDAVVLDAQGRQDEALAAAIREEERFAAHSYTRTVYSAMRALLEGRLDDCRRATVQLSDVRTTDGEARYFVTRFHARLGDEEPALDLLERVIDQGFVCIPLFRRDPWLAGLRTHPRFADLTTRATARHEAVRARFEREGGLAVLGIGHPV